MRLFPLFIVTSTLALFAPLTLCGNEKEIEFYEQKIKPLLTLRCVTCHGPLKQEGDLRVDAGQFLLQKNEEGTLVIPGNSKNSRLIDAILGRNDALQMPMEGNPLTQEELSMLTQWVEHGAHFPTDEKVVEDPTQHWAFQPPVRPEVPEVSSPEWSLNPIDRFVFQKYDEHQLQPVAELDRRMWLRRVTLDLTGVPPTVDEVQQYLNDSSPTANDTVIERLLSSPEHGERWGRHWMDVWRYSDWYGYKAELRSSGRHMWRWRDWIVESLNEDKPYNRMVMEMVAGDELEPGNLDSMRATGFLVRNYYKFNRNTWMERTIEHTGKAFMGLTMNCARCHDHKYDPISQPEYYQFRAIFEPHQVRVDRLAENPNPEQLGVSLIYDKDLTQPTYLFEGGNEAKVVKEKAYEPALPTLFSGLAEFEVEAIDLPPEGFYPGFRSEVRESILKAAQAQLNQARASQAQWQQKLNKASAQELPHVALETKLHAERLKQSELKLKSLQAVIMADQARYGSGNEALSKEELQKLIQTAIDLQRQQTIASARFKVTEAELAVAKAEASTEQDKKKKQTAINKQQKILKDAQKKLAETTKEPEKPLVDYKALTPKYPEKSTGRRLAFAKWLADEKNPLTARVAVNHLWMRHFGEPLVPTTFDFGLNGKSPSHPELLDWLAIELMENNWSMKHLHQLMVSSHLYQLKASGGTESENRVKDNDNVYLWKMNRRRAEAELVRDAVLAVTGQMQRHFGGAEIDAAQGETTYRRSIYYRHAPEKMMTFMEVFDAANTNECYRRAVTIVPQQALALTNSQLSLELARRYTSQITSKEQPQSEFVETVFEQLLSRAPEKEERTACLEFLKEQQRRLSQPDQLSQVEGGPKPAVAASNDHTLRARENLVHVLMNHNEFVFIP